MKALFRGKRKIFFVTLLAIFGFFTQNRAQAIQIFAETKNYIEGKQEIFEVSVFLNTEGEEVNVVKGKMLIPEEKMKFIRTRTGGSILQLWLDSPISYSAGEIGFIGGIPGGYRGERGLMFTAFFSKEDKEASGEVELVFRDLEYYLNDGRGTVKEIEDFRQILRYDFWEEIIRTADASEPEVFSPYVTKNPDLENGKWVVIFSAQDKGEGIDHYEIFESLEKYDPEKIATDGSVSWKIAQGSRAYVLQDQKLGSYIYVKAVDKAGNYKVAVVIPAGKKTADDPGYKKLLTIVAIVIFVIAILLEAVIFTRKLKVR